jgi:hypothetical protein
MLMLPDYTENLSKLRTLVVHSMVLCISPHMAMSQLLQTVMGHLYVCVCHRWLQPGRVSAAEQRVHPAM